MKIFENNKFAKAVFASIILVAVIAAIDIMSAHSGVFGTVEQYTNGQFGVQGWWYLFFHINLVLLATLPVMYYFFVRQDKSESIALFLNSIVLWFTGLPDILYFWFQGKAIPSILPWLNGGYVGKISHIFGFAQVTSISLIISTLIGLAIAYLISKIMEKID